MGHSASTPSEDATTTPKVPKKRTTVTFYLTDAMRNRARAAYRQTSYDERDTSWSEMINKALLAEVQRRERAYNGGRAFVGNDEPLTPGRPIGY
ncbi:ParB family protein [Leifsonia poae]|uniref:ParB family protein n=1 Tax=Leifsonia poae TaxID=110933 RepID=UPI003D69C62A